MKTAMKILWLYCPFAAAAALDCGAPVNVVAWFVLAWVISAAAWLEIIKRKAEKRDQRRLNKCRNRAGMGDNRAVR